MQTKNEAYDTSQKRKEDKDLVIEENTIYEIDRECYDRIRKSRRRKFQ